MAVVLPAVRAVSSACYSLSPFLADVTMCFVGLVQPPSVRPLFRRALLMLGIGVLPPSAVADPPIWVNARHVKATETTCSGQRSILFKSDAFKGPMPPTPSGCSSAEYFYVQLNVAKAFVNSRTGDFAAQNTDAGLLTCEGDLEAGKPRGLVIVGTIRGVLILGTSSAIARTIAEHPAPRGCRYVREKFQFASSVGRIPFTDVENGGTMSIRESLALHARERDRAIAECNASAACRAEVQRRSAINAYYDCMRPLQRGEPDRVCRRPW